MAQARERGELPTQERAGGLAPARVDIEPRLRKVVGYRHLPKLREALQRKTPNRSLHSYRAKPETTSTSGFGINPGSDLISLDSPKPQQIWTKWTFCPVFCPVLSINRLFATGYSQLSTFRSEPNTALKRSTSPQSDDPTYTQVIPLPHRSIAYRLDLAVSRNRPHVGKCMGEVDPWGVSEVNIIEVLPIIPLFGKKPRYAKIPVNPLYTPVADIFNRF